MVSKEQQRFIRKMAISAAPGIITVGALVGGIYFLATKARPFLESQFGSWLMLNDNWQDNISTQVAGDLKKSIETDPLLNKTWNFQEHFPTNNTYGEAFIIHPSFANWLNTKAKISVAFKERSDLIHEWFEESGMLIKSAKVLDILNKVAVNPNITVTQNDVNDFNTLFDMALMNRSRMPLKVKEAFSFAESDKPKGLI